MCESCDARIEPHPSRFRGIDNRIDNHSHLPVLFAFAYLMNGRPAFVFFLNKELKSETLTAGIERNRSPEKKKVNRSNEMRDSRREKECSKGNAKGKFYLLEFNEWQYALEVGRYKKTEEIQHTKKRANGFWKKFEKNLELEIRDGCEEFGWCIRGFFLRPAASNTCEWRAIRSVSMTPG